MKKEIYVSEKLFEFTDYQDWIVNGRDKFKNSDTTIFNTICIDSLGRICRSGKDFSTAANENTYPIEVFLI